KSDASTCSPVELPKDGAGSEPSVSFGAPEENRMGFRQILLSSPPTALLRQNWWPCSSGCLKCLILSVRGLTVSGCWQRRSTLFHPVPFFRRFIRSLLRSKRLSSSLLTPLDGGAARGYVDVPQVERAVAVH
ncbi:hypothetical protein M9458_001354, partial [Cirrhinus mrigala]